MTIDTEILIVGAGPSGLMMACQLTRFGIPFRIIDKKKNRTMESRAFGIQAKSMEIFQNLGLSSIFLKKEIVGKEINFYFNGKHNFKFNFSNINREDTPFPSIYFLPQSETEAILLEFLEKRNIFIEWQTELNSFKQTNECIEANITNHIKAETKNMVCDYIIGCDGAHSVVRNVLDIPFVGAAYNQEFILADVSIHWKFPKNNFTAFMSTNGIVLFIPLNTEQDIARLIIADLGNLISNFNSKENPLTILELERMVNQVTHSECKITKSIWSSRFHLHHRAVELYQKGNAFLIGDAAHIHSPVGAQGMNTGLQDATNLAWKIACVLKYHSPHELLKTYQTERQRIGEVLVKSTDRIFGFLIQKNLITSLVRQYVFPLVMKFLTKFKTFNTCLFNFVSELNIHYHPNPFIFEKLNNADTTFIAGPKAGWRAPDAPTEDSSLFDILSKKPFNILIFSPKDNAILDYKILQFIEKHSELIGIHQFVKTKEQELLFKCYGVSTTAVYFIRPDGYIGFRSFGENLESLSTYLNALFNLV